MANIHIVIRVPDKYDPKTLSNIFRDLIGRISDAGISTKEVYTVSNVGSDVRDLDVSAATLAELRDFVGTLIRDLQANGRIGK